MSHPKKALGHSTPTAVTLVTFALGTCAVSEVCLSQLAFTVEQYVPSDYHVTSVCLAPMTSDAQLDVVTLREDGLMLEFANNGAGFFEQDHSFFYRAEITFGMRTADFDGNGLYDLLWSNVRGGVSRLCMLYQEPLARDSVFVTETQPADLVKQVLTDIDSDGDLDMVACRTRRRDRSSLGAVYVFLNTNGRLAICQYVELDWNDSPDIAVGDIDGDGDVDVVALNSDLGMYYERYKAYERQIAVLLNDGTGRLIPGPMIPVPYDDKALILQRIEAGDVDNDGDLDLAVSVWRDGGGNGEKSHCLILYNNGDGSIFTQTQKISLAYSSAQMLALSDFDIDGDLDMVADSGDVWQGIVGFFENDGSGTYALSDTLVTDVEFPSDVAIDDVNGDGLPDCVVSGRTGFTVITNQSAYDGPLLEIGPLIRGGQGTFTVTRLNPGERADFIYTRNNLAPSLGISHLGGMVLDLAAPTFELGSAVADSQGQAVLDVGIPAKAPPITIHAQAYVRRGNNGELSVKTPAVLARIERK